jgi:Putative adhesin
MRRKSLLILVLLCCAAAFGDEWKREYKVGSNPELRVDTNDARIEVRRGGPTIQARVVTEGYKIGPGDVHIYEREDGNAVSLDVRIPTGPSFSFRNRYVHVEVSVPQNTKIDLHSGDGSLSLSGTDAPAFLSTGDGRIDVSDFSGPLKAKTGDGSMHISGRFDDLNLSTGDGRIECEVLAGSKMSGRWVIRTNDGSLSLHLPPKFAADLDARTGDGHVRVNMPITMKATDSDGHRVRGAVNGGGNLLDIQTGDGSVEVYD